MFETKERMEEELDSGTRQVHCHKCGMEMHICEFREHQLKCKGQVTNEPKVLAMGLDFPRRPCPFCGGKGAIGAKCADDVPMSMRPIGVMVCHHCHGKGTLPDMTSAIEAVLQAKEGSNECNQC